MKLVIASDLHGSAKYTRELLAAFEREGADRLLLLGDILYHGPRNPLPEEYCPAEVAKELSRIKEKIICVRGNCDSEVDQMVLDFCITNAAAVFCDGTTMYLAHGHGITPPLSPSDVYITGHTHVQLNDAGEGFLHLNPGSVSLPKEDSKRAYILFDGGMFYFKTLDGQVFDKAKAPAH